MGVKLWLVGIFPYAAMVCVEILDVGLTTISKAAMSQGMSHFVFVVYSNALSTLILLPSSYFLERKKRPPLTFSLLCKFFILSIIGITIMQNCVFTGVNYSSPTLASAMSNLIPAFTFLLAVIFRMEKVDLRSTKSQIKVLGTMVSISGALIVTLFKGPSIGSLKDQSTSSYLYNGEALPSLNYLYNLLEIERDWVVGGIFLAIASLSVSIWNTSQAVILKGYPSELTIVAFYCLFGAFQCAALTLVAEAKDPNAWVLKPNIELISVIYSAIFGGVVTYSTQTWCIHKKGPVFVAIFKPVGIAIAALFGVIFLGDTLCVGSVIGAVVIVVGLYGVIWAQSKEERKETNPIGSEKAPLLQPHCGPQKLFYS